MKYFDFHTHVIFKQLFDDNPNIDARIKSTDVNGLPRLCTDLPTIIETQIHQSQLSAFQDEVIVGVVLYGLESYLAKEVIPLRDFLKGGSQHKLSLQLLNDVVSNQVKAFTDFTLRITLDTYLNASSSFNVLSKASFNAPLPKNRVNIFFVIEGCHSLVDSINEVLPPAQIFSPQEILNNLDILLQKAKVLSINPTHLQQSNLCNHAFGIQLTQSKPFYPRGNGLTGDGRDVIQGIFDRSICIDLKHMSFKSRFDLLADLDAGQFSNPQPVLCTHSGFTGIRFSDWPGYISLKRTKPDVFYLELAKTMQVRNQPQRPGAPSFNMTTINLFDEEIAWIVRNGGVIGLSMDRRIMGYVDKFDDRPTGTSAGSSLIVDKEYISKDEWNKLNISNSKIGKLAQSGDCMTMEDLELSVEDGIPRRDEFFFDHVLLHIKHFFQVCITDGIPFAEAQKHITLGSDFDGLINPFINIQTVESMSDLKQYIKMNLRFYLDTLTDSRQWSHQLDPIQFADDLFYNNGFNFIKSRFQ